MSDTKSDPNAGDPPAGVYLARVSFTNAYDELVAGDTEAAYYAADSGLAFMVDYADDFPKDWARLSHLVAMIHAERYAM
tara:strand:+ start:172 stop:408 length:237 start_codon:yes stop_codon:yes gene_type:complete